LKGYIEERAVEIANYIIDNNATVRQTAKQFGISKSTVHTDATKRNDLRYIQNSRRFDFQ
jgi:putative DeoR family transcriptional regulator (stage III sporulation protein D)